MPTQLLLLSHSLSTTRFVASFFVVRLSQKFQKLFTRDAAESLWEHVYRWMHPVSPRRILGTIDQAELVRLREDYPYRPNARKINAYEDADYWVGVNVKRVQDLCAFFESQGARIVRWKALLAQDPAERPRFKQVR